MCKFFKTKQKMWHEILEKPIGGSAKRQHINFLAKKMNGGNESN
jgi:hypothetical protein